MAPKAMHRPSQLTLSHLKFRHLMLIRLLDELGTLRKASEALSISQPAATAMLRDLESLIGIGLFDRSHRGVQVTSAGRELLDTVKRLLNEFREFGQAIERIQLGEEPQLRVGVVPQAFVTYLPQAIARFRQEGGARIHAEQGTGRQLLSELMAGNLDCMVGRMPTGAFPAAWDLSTLSFENLYAEEICIVAGLGCPRPSRGRPTFEWLAERDWVLQRADSSVRGALQEAFLRAGVHPPTPIVETSTYIQSLSLAAKMAVFTVAPRGPAEITQQAGTVRILKVDLQVSPMQVCFIHRHSSEGSGQLALFQDCFRRAVQEDMH